MRSVRRNAVKALTDAGFTEAVQRRGGHRALIGPGFCAEHRDGHAKIMISYIGGDGQVARSQEAQIHLSAYAAVLVAAAFTVDRISGAYPCLSISRNAVAANPRYRPHETEAVIGHVCGL